MSAIEIKKIVKAIQTSDGAGVKLKRSMGIPELDFIDPFLMFDEFGSENKDDYIAGFPPHPHRGIETVTYMLNGEFRHEDSTGNKGDLGPGSVQWMTAAGGIIHSEMPIMKEGKLHGFQLWVNMPAKLKMGRPSYQNIEPKEIPEFKDQEKKIKIIINLIILISPLIILIRLIKNKEDKIRFKEKFCFFSKKRGNGKLIWFHGSSIGEILSIIPLIEKLEKKKSISKILVTSSTLSSSKVLSKFKLRKFFT